MTISDARYIEAPNELSFKQELTPETWGRPVDLPGASVFLAGGITGCEEWQRPMARKLLAATKSLVVVNPRRDNFPIDDPNAAEAQITWEHDALRFVSAVSVWFTNATMQPICLYELGAWSMTRKPLFVGVQPGYAREQDVRIQTRLARPEVVIVDNIDDLCAQIVAYANSHTIRHEGFGNPRPDGLY